MSDNEEIKELHQRISTIAENIDDRLQTLNNRIGSRRELGENTYWILFNTLVAIVLCAFIASITYCSVHSHTEMRLMVEKGENPIAARCAYGNSHDDSICLAYISTIKK